MFIAAFDPGITTGYALSEGDSYQFGHLPETLTGIYDFLTLRKPRIVVYEDFKHRPQIITTEMYSLQVIGVLNLWAEQNSIPVYYSLPAETKAFWTDKKLKALGLYVVGNNHARDALRVLLTYRMKAEPEWFDKILRVLNDKL